MESGIISLSPAPKGVRFRPSPPTTYVDFAVLRRRLKTDLRLPLRLILVTAMNPTGSGNSRKESQVARRIFQRQSFILIVYPALSSVVFLYQEKLHRREAFLTPRPEIQRWSPR